MKCIMDPNNQKLLLCVIAAGLSTVLAGGVYAQRKKRKKLNLVSRRKPRRWWVRPIYQNRLQQGDFHNLVGEMRLYDTEMFFHYTRMNIEQFDQLLSIVGPSLKKSSHRAPLSAQHRLAITLRFLATGSSLQTLAFQFRIGKSTVCQVLHETCATIWLILRNKVFVTPTKENWYKIADHFHKVWNFPHCIGALDGKHCRIKCPNASGTRYFKYKKFFSIILLAMCDGQYRFTMVDVGGMGSESDGGLFSRTEFARRLEEQQLDLPPPEKIGSFNFAFPYYLVADEAFPLKYNIMRPYPGRDLSKPKRIFNYRLSRARRIIENSFGILVSRWQIFQGPIIADVENAEKYILAAVCLHNYLRLHDQNNYCPANYVDREVNGDIQLGEWRQNVFNDQFFQRIPRAGTNNAKRSIFRIRNLLCDYFQTAEGAVPWQEAHVNRGNKNSQAAD